MYVKERLEGGGVRLAVVYLATLPPPSMMTLSGYQTSPPPPPTRPPRTLQSVEHGKGCEGKGAWVVDPPLPAATLACWRLASLHSAHHPLLSTWARHPALQAPPHTTHTPATESSLLVFSPCWRCWQGMMRIRPCV